MRVGILGGGQLARMLALAGHPLGMQFRVFDPATDAPAAAVAEHVCAAYNDIKALEVFYTGLDVLTYEFENIPLEVFTSLPLSLSVAPHVRALEVAQDRLNEKTLFKRLGIDTPKFKAVSNVAEARQVCQEFGFPVVLKTRRMGYDGKGQAVIRDEASLQAAFEQLNSEALILEEFVSFDCEVSILAVRDAEARICFYPLTENVHREGILRTSTVDIDRFNPVLVERARSYIAELLSTLEYVGVLCLELFVAGDRLLANEIAPRVHNSGHWTIEGAACSQFENHLRAIASLPLGATAVRGFPAMENIIGEMPPLGSLLQVPNVHVHCYGKQAKIGRKLGHATLIAASRAERDQTMTQLQAICR